LRVEYHGKNLEEGIKSRQAWIVYDKKEEQQADRIFEQLVDASWEGFAEEECLYFNVTDKEDYGQFIKDYKEQKEKL
jgi:hypothetical protein